MLTNFKRLYNEYPKFVNSLATYSLHLIRKSSALIVQVSEEGLQDI
jgi:hypothetical protein